jgi:hypothetical protein
VTSQIKQFQRFIAFGGATKQSAVALHCTHDHTAQSCLSTISRGLHSLQQLLLKRLGIQPLKGNGECYAVGMQSVCAIPCTAR